MDLAKLVVRLEAQSAQLLTELEKANKKIDRFASSTSKTLQKWSAGLLTFFSARAIFNWSKDVVKAQGDLVSMAEVANTSVENLSSLGYAAEQSSSSLEGLNKGLGTLANTSAEASKGSKDAKAAFATLGIQVTDSNGRLKDSSDLLLEIADQFAQYENGAAKAALAQDFFGKAGKELIPLLNRGAAGIKALQAEADRLDITVGTDAANAANSLNDNLAKLSRTAGGITGQVLAPLVETLNGLLESMLGSAQGAHELGAASTALVTGLKLIADIGSRVWETFVDVGSALGALASAAVQAAQGNFREASAIITAANEEGAARDEFYTNFRAKLWEDAGEKVVAAAQKTDQALKKTLVFGGGESALEEVNITVQKIEPTAMEEFYAELDKLTQTATEKANAAYAEQRASITALFEDGQISAEQYALRLEAINKQLADGLGITQRQEDAAARLKKIQDDGRAVFEATRTPLEKYNAELVNLNNLLYQGAIDQETYNRAVEQSQDAYDDATNGAKKFFEEATRNAQDILGDGIYDAISGGASRGIDGLISDFGDMLTKLAAQAVAANIGGLLFGQQGVGGDSGLVGAAFSAIGSFFGGPKDTGGRGRPGMAYAIGTGAQPEVFVPDQPGNFYPRGEGLGGGGKVTQNIYVQGRVDQRSARQLELEAVRRQRVANARLG